MQLDLESISSLIDAGKGQNGYFASQLEESFAPFFDKLQNIKQDKRQIDINNLFNMDQQTSDRFRKKYHNALKKFLTVFGKKISQLHSASISDLLFNNTGRGGNSKVKLPSSGPSGGPPPLPKNTKNLTEQKETATPVHIESVSDKLMDKLSTMNPTINQTNIKTGKGSKDGEGGSLLKKILGGALIAMVAGIGAYLLREGFLSDGKFKGLLKILGQTLIAPFVKFVKGITETLLPMKKMGSIFSAIKKLPSIAMSVLGIFHPKTGIISRFIKTILSPKKVIASVGKGLRSIPSVGKSLFGTLFKMFKGGGKAGAKIVFKSIPVLGTLISFAFAYSRFKAGDTLGGFLEIAAGLSSMIPIIGPALSAGINIMLAIRDMTTTKEERSGPVTLGAVGDFFKSIGAKLWEWVKGLWGWITGAFDKIMDSPIVKQIKLKITNVFLSFKWAFFTFTDTISNIMNWIIGKFTGFLNQSWIKGTLNTIGLGGVSDEIAAMDEVAKIRSSGQGKRADEVIKQMEANEDEVKKIEMEAKKEREKMHKETLQSNAENTAAIVNATNGTTAAVAGTRNAGGNTTFLFNNDGKNGLRRAKDRGFRQVYRNEPIN